MGRFAGIGGGMPGGMPGSPGVPLPPQGPNLVGGGVPPAPDMSNMPLNAPQGPNLGVTGQPPPPLDPNVKAKLLSAASDMAKALQQPQTGARRPTVPSDFSVPQTAPLPAAPASPAIPPWMQPNPNAFYGGR
jgi:hypothetical protein